MFHSASDSDQGKDSNGFPRSYCVNESITKWGGSNPVQTLSLAQLQ